MNGIAYDSPQKIRYYLPTRDVVQWFDQGGGSAEQALIEWARETFAHSGKAFVDVGAHVGSWTLNLASSFAQTFAFEAQRATFELLERGIRDMPPRIAPTIQARHCAIGAAPGKATLRVISADGGGSSVAELPTNIEPLATECVRVRTLDEFELRNVGLIKIDVEGSEEDVLRGAVRTLAKSGRPPVLFECWDHAWFTPARESLFARFRALGYKTERTSWPEMYLATRLE